jgi:hypothetical protein
VHARGPPGQKQSPGRRRLVNWTTRAAPPRPATKASVTHARPHHFMLSSIASGTDMERLNASAAGRHSNVSSQCGNWILECKQNESGENRSRYAFTKLQKEHISALGSENWKIHERNSITLRKQFAIQSPLRTNSKKTTTNKRKEGKPITFGRWEGKPRPIKRADFGNWI